MSLPVSIPAEIGAAPVIDHGPSPHWQVLVVSSRPDFHQGSGGGDRGFRILGRDVAFEYVDTLEEARRQCAQTVGIAIVLLDLDAVVATPERAIDGIKALRQPARNPHQRIVLVTSDDSQWGQDWMDSALIDDVRSRSDLRQERFFRLLYANLRQYNEVLVADQSRKGIERIVDASSTILRRKMPERLARGGLQLLCSVLGLGAAAQREPSFDAILVRISDQDEFDVLARLGATEVGSPEAAEVPALAADDILALEPPSRDALWSRKGTRLSIRMRGESNVDYGVCISHDKGLPLTSDEVLHVFCRHLCNSMVAAEMHQSITRTQNGLILMLSEAIERRSMETSNHVRRVGEYSRLLGRLYGFHEEEADRLLIAAALHDAGKVAIPDAILNKPGKLSPEERAIMETHASIGARMFEGQDLPVLQAAMTIAIQHHERWDGCGYPARLKGEQIHIYGRIAGLADVFDALGSHRCYKPAWSLEDVLAFISAERERHFDPELVDLLLDNLSLFLEIRERYVDPPPKC